MKSTRAPLLANAWVCAALTFVIHLIGNPHYGFFRDELYFIICGFRPDWGYVDQPPMVPLLAAASQYFGQSLVLLRAIPSAFAAASVYITLLLVAEFGGGIFAGFTAALVTFFCPVLMNFGMKVSTDMPGLLLWPLAALLIVRALKGESRSWIFAGLTLGLAFQAKISVIFFAAAIFAGILLTGHRRALLSRHFWIAVFIFIIISLPYIFWQFHHDLPMLELLQNSQKGKTLILSPSEFMLAQLLITNPILSLVWISGVIWLFRNSVLRFLGVAWWILMLEMMVLHGKHYYSANYYPILIAAGGVALESWTQQLRALRPWITGTAIVAGLVLVPYAMPILPEKSFVAYHHVVGPLLHIERTKAETHSDGPLIQDWADMHGWPELAAEVARVYASLSVDEQGRAIIIANNYGQASAIKFFGRKFSLPEVLSGHNQYYLWGTHENSGDILIDVDGNCRKEINLYQRSTLGATFTHPWVMPYENNIPIMICKDIKKSLSEVWPATKYYR